MSFVVVRVFREFKFRRDESWGLNFDRFTVPCPDAKLLINEFRNVTQMKWTLMFLESNTEISHDDFFAFAVFLNDCGNSQTRNFQCDGSLNTTFYITLSVK